MKSARAPAKARCVNSTSRCSASDFVFLLAGFSAGFFAESFVSFSSVAFFGLDDCLHGKQPRFCFFAASALAFS